MPGLQGPLPMILCILLFVSLPVTFRRTESFPSPLSLSYFSQKQGLTSPHFFMVYNHTKC